MDPLDAKLRDLQAMIGAERDARRADVHELRTHLQAMDKRLAESNERTSGYEAAVIDVLGEMRSELHLRGNQLDSSAQASKRASSIASPVGE